MNIKLYTQWKDNQIVCTCPTCKCKNHNCELLDFTLNPYADIKSCMRSDSYKRVRGNLQQR